MKKYHKNFHFGCIDYKGNGYSRYPVEVELTYAEKKPSQMVLSISGNVWLPGRRDIVMGGQCLDSILPFLKDNETFMELHRLWELYHLNDMHPECEHQRELGWVEKASQKVTLYHYSLTHDAISKQNKLKKKVEEALLQGKSFRYTKEERKLAALSYSVTLPEEIKGELAQFYQPRKSMFLSDHGFKEEKILGWLKPEEHPDGVLCAPCPVCGYKYGTSWNFVPIPKEDEDKILALIAEPRVKY